MLVFLSTRVNHGLGKLLDRQNLKLYGTEAEKDMYTAMPTDTYYKVHTHTHLMDQLYNSNSYSISSGSVFHVVHCLSSGCIVCFVSPRRWRMIV